MTVKCTLARVEPKQFMDITDRSCPCGQPATAAIDTGDGPVPVCQLCLWATAKNLAHYEAERRHGQPETKFRPMSNSHAPVTEKLSAEDHEELQADLNE